MEEMMLMEDADASILEILKMGLEKEGFRVVPITRCNGSVATIIDKSKPHTVFPGLKLAMKYCIGICHEVKKKFPHLPVIALSYNIDIAEESDREGFDAYIQKPYDLDLLYMILRKHLPLTSVSLINN